MSAMYQKDPNITYSDMCIYIDNNIYTDNYDKNLVYEYLYHLVKMFSYKAKYFYTTEDYENFALYLATRLYLRLTNPKQFEVDESGNPKLKKIKSIRNYIIKVIDSRRVDYQQEFYCQNVHEIDEEELSNEFTLSYRLADGLKPYSISSFKLSLEDVIYIAKMFLQRIPYRTDKVE